MKIVVDTNIVFSAILTPTGKIGKLLTAKRLDIHYLAPDFLLEELHIHTPKILKLTGYRQQQYERLKMIVTKNIEFISVNHISPIKKKAEEVLRNIDIKDVPFLALECQENACLWTGDKKLIQSLHTKKNFEILTTDTLYSRYF